MLKEMLENVRKKHPMVHTITNYVTMNDCANVLLACGASPIMADDIMEAEEITSLSDGLVINMGTLSQARIPAMLAAGKKANALGHPVLFDPVGAGASSFRMQTAEELQKKIRFTAIRGNVSEIKALALGTGALGGVDADEGDGMGANIEETAAFVRRFAKKSGAVVLVTGAVDLVADADHACAVFHGHPMMRTVTGTGCQLSAMTAAYLAANPKEPFTAVLAAAAAMGICGEKAYQRMQWEDGSASYRIYLMDAVSRLSGEELERCAKYEICR